ncbi:hypothetical protein glysoja_025308 [Glycine soja]|uniref:Uncharacterized protein n=1 Tax=Glycine soja TaxID=3848 RepID=A0A0B2SQH0_GLYSO|nr:hypothetical protein glysoja_025308 [Glycine soja]
MHQKIFLLSFELSPPKIKNKKTVTEEKLHSPRQNERERIGSFHVSLSPSLSQWVLC